MKTAKQSTIKVIEKLYFRQKVEAGLKDLEEGRTIPHEQVKKRLARWLK